MSKALQFMTYAEYLQTDRWRETRAAAIAGAPRCALCPREFANVCSGPGPHVHHRDYSRLGEELPEDLVVLCDRCHEAYELGRQILQGAPAVQKGSVSQPWGGS